MNLNMFRCSRCNQSFTRRSDLQHHVNRRICDRDRLFVNDINDFINDNSNLLQSDSSQSIHDSEDLLSSNNESLRNSPPNSDVGDETSSTSSRSTRHLDQEIIEDPGEIHVPNNDFILEYNEVDMSNRIRMQLNDDMISTASSSSLSQNFNPPSDDSQLENNLDDNSSGINYISELFDNDLSLYYSSQDESSSTRSNSSQETLYNDLNSNSDSSVYSSTSSSLPYDTNDDSSNSIHVAEAQLLHLFVKYSIPLYTYSKFFVWAQLVQNTNYDFDLNQSTFSSAIKKLSRSRQMSHLKPKMSTVQLPSLPDVNVRYFSFLKNVKELCRDQDLMQGSLWSYDADSSYYSELNTGSWWKKTEESLHRRLLQFRVRQPNNHFLCPVILFIDKTHCDRNGRLNAEPILCSIGNILLDKRKKPSSWFFLGLLPMQHRSSTERAAARRGRGLRSIYVEQYHSCLQICLQELMDLQERERTDGIGSRVFVHGLGNVHLHFEICFIVGDTEGHDSLCCHFAGYSSRVSRPIRTCDVTWDNLDQPHTGCTFVDSEDIFKIVGDCIENINRRVEVTTMRDSARQISQHLHIPVFRDIYFGSNPHGIFAATPFETLHTLLLGIIRYVLECLYKYKASSDVEDGSLVCVFRKEEFERRIRIISQATKRQSDRDMPRCTFNSGVVSLKGINGEEYIGLSLITIAALPEILPNRRIEKEFTKLLWLGISLHSCLKSSRLSKDEVENNLLQEKINRYIELFVQICGRQRNIISPLVGCKLPKLHGLTHFCRQIKCFGSAENFNGTYSESNLKTFIKYPAKTTRKTHSDFSEDIVNRWSHHACVSKCISQMDTRYSLDFLIANRMRDNNRVSHNTYHPQGCIPLHNESNDIVKLGKTRFYYSFMDTERSWYTCYGRRKERGIFHPYLTLDDLQLQGLSFFLNREMRTNRIKRVACHYHISTMSSSYEPKFLLRCHPKYRSKPWFDWITADFARGNDEYSIPSRLYMLLSIEGALDDDLDTGGRNNNVNRVSLSTKVYALIHPLRNYNTPRYPHLRCWNIDNIDGHSQVVSFSRSVSGTCFVLPSSIDSRSNSQRIEDGIFANQHYIVIPPRDSWSQIGWDN